MLLTNRLTLDGAISYEAVCCSTGKSALQSTTRSGSLEIHITQHYGWQKTVDAIWDDYLTIRTARNGELYRKDYDKQWAIALETTWAKVEQLYEGSKHYVNDAEIAILHARPLKQILTWTKVHLDVYLATAEVILEQKQHWPRIVRVPLEPMLEHCGMGGGGWYHNSVKTSIFKILLIFNEINNDMFWD
jgi:hypothetical protein